MILVRTPARDGKAQALEELKETGVFLIYLVKDPVDASPLGSYVQT